MVDSSEEKLAVLVLKQESLFFSAFDLLDQEAASLRVPVDPHPGHLRQYNSDGLAAGLFRQFGDQLLREGMEEDRAAALAVAHYTVQGLAPAHPVLCLACRPDAHVRNDGFHLLLGSLLTVV